MFTYRPARHFAAVLLSLSEALISAPGVTQSRPHQPSGIRDHERSVQERLRADQPRVAPLEAPLTVRAVEIVWSPPGERPLFTADSLRALVEPIPLLAGEFEIGMLTLFEPHLRLERGEGDREWNFERALAALTSPGRSDTISPPAPGSAPEIVVRDLTVVQGTVEILPPSGREVAIRDISAEAPEVAISGVDRAGPTIDLTRLAASLEIPGEEVELAITIDDAEVVIEPERVGFEVARIGADSSVLTDAVGEYRPGAPGLGIDASIVGERVLLADLRVFLPRAPSEGVATFVLDLETNSAGRSTLDFPSVDIVADDSHIFGALSLAFGGSSPPGVLGVDLTLDPLALSLIEGFTGPLPYGGTISGTIRGPPSRVEFDLAARLTTPDLAEPFTARLVGDATFAGEGFQLATLDVDLQRVPLLAFRPFIPGLAMEGVVSGHLLMEGMPGEVPTTLDLRLELAAGVLTIAGVIDFSGAATTYDLSGRIIDVYLQDLLEPPVPPVNLTADFALRGVGTSPVGASARLDLSGYFTGWQTGPADSLLVRAELEQGTLRVDTASIRLGPLLAEVAGTWRFEPPDYGALRYTVTTSTVDPFAPYIARFDGLAVTSLNSSGSLSGPLSLPRLQGDLDAARVVYDGWSADTLSATYDLNPTDPISHIELDLTARRVETPIGDFADAVATLSIVDTLLVLDIHAASGAGQAPLIVVADGTLGPGEEGDIVVRRLSFPLDGGVWAIDSPTRVQWIEGGEAIAIEDLVLRQMDGPGRVAIDGRYPPSVDDELLIEATELPVGELLIVAGYGPVLTGRLSLDLRLRGPAEDATAGGTFRLIDGSYRGQAITLAEGIFLAEDRRLEIQATAQLDTAGSVRADASIPLVLNTVAFPEVSIPRDEPITGTATIDSLALRILALSVPELQEVEGYLDAEVRISGTLASPNLIGDARVIDGAATIVPVNRRYDQISGTFTLAGEVIEVLSLRAHSDGWATAEGRIDLAEAADPTIDLTVTFDGFRAIGVDDQEPAAVDGALQVGGTLQEPVITGAVTLDDGNFPIPEFGGGTSMVAADLATTELFVDGEDLQPAGESLFERLRLEDVTVTAGDNLWVVTEQVRAQLAGELTLNKDEEGLRISGTLEGDRGTFTLRVGPLVRRFTLVQTNIRFLGTPEIDPLLDITASRIIPGAGAQFTEILLHLGGSLSNPDVEVTTAEGASVPESELLSFLLFGRPSFASPGQTPLGGPVLEEAVFGIGSLAEIASIGLEEAILSDLGLPIDYFLIQPSQGPFGGLGAPTIVIGEEIAPDVYLTVNTGLGGLFGAASTPATAWSISLQWRITSQWTLELGVEPVNPARFFRGLGTALPIVGFERQVIVELRRRWTY